MQWYVKVLQNYAVFNGRARRKEYWMFTLFNFLISFGIGVGLGVISAVIHSDLAPLSFIYSLAVLLPSYAVGVRRMHDTNHSGWWLLCPIYNLVLACTDGEPRGNQYGPDPKASYF